MQRLFLVVFQTCNEETCGASYPKPIILFNNMCTAEYSFLGRSIWSQQGMVSNNVRHSWNMIELLVELVNEHLLLGEEPLPMPQCY